MWNDGIGLENLARAIYSTHFDICYCEICFFLREKEVDPG